MNHKSLRIRFMSCLLTILILLSTLANIDIKVYAASADVTGFVTRLYQQCLNRDPEKAGLAYWVNGLIAGTYTGAVASENFIFSKEFVDKNMSNDNFLNIMYKSFFNREADAAGKTYWMNKLISGATRRFVLSSFVNSNEFSSVCTTYGITRGAIVLSDNVDLYPDITAFVQRFYLKCIDRMPDSVGLEYWVNALVSKNSTAADLAVGFTSSTEFVAKNLSDSDFITIMYRVFLDREADIAGQAYWQDVSNSGKTRQSLVAGFVDSTEFKSLCSTYGINSGSVTITIYDSLKAEIISNLQNRTATFAFLWKGDLKDCIDTAKQIMKDMAYTNPYEYYNMSNMNLSGTETSYQATTTTLNFTMEYRTTKVQEDYVTEQVNEILPKIISTSMTAVNKELAIHDWIVNNVQYDSSLTKYTAYDALAKYSAVCEGYALLTYKMLTKAGIQAYIVAGTTNNGQETASHAWNLVNIDGSWYHLDTTWDDPVSSKPILSHSYFNLTDDQISKDHFWDKTGYPTVSKVIFVK